MKVLITGHKGFVGSRLYKKLKSKGYDVSGYDRGDFLPINKVDIVFHLAANPKVYESIKKPSLAFENITITYKILEWMKIKGVNKIIFASSTEIHGIKTPYSASKLASENLIEAFCNSYNMGGVSLRFSNIYGPGDRKDRFIPTAVRRAKKNKPIKVYGEKGNFIFIDDCIKIYLDAIKFVEKGKHKVYEVVNKSKSLVSIAEEIVKMTSSKSQIKISKGLKKCIKGGKK